MRLAGLALRLQGAAVVIDEAVGLDFDTSAVGSAVDLHFDAGDGNVDAGAPVVVPDVRGYTPAFAKRKLQAAGLGVVTIAAGGRDGRVSEQQPPAGTQALSGTLVRLTLR
jgi:beta-lactam-binding protein with PASTA domain